MTTHHPSEALLADYASGAIATGAGAVVAAHLEGCGHCRSALKALEALGGEIIETLSETALSPEAVDRALAALDGPMAPFTPARPTLERIPFSREFRFGPGMGLAKAKVSGKGLLYQLRLPAGGSTFDHGHDAPEYIAVLKGAFSDGHTTYTAGDFVETGVEVEHAIKVTPDGECICLIASEEPLKAVNLAGRLFQVVARI
jgi:putative transcriptional regulator